MILSSPSPLQSVYQVVVVDDGVLFFIYVCKFFSRFILDGIELEGLDIVGWLLLNGMGWVNTPITVTTTISISTQCC